MVSSTINDLLDDQLIEIYYRAKELDVDKDFINLIEEELKKRTISKDNFSFS